MEGTPNFDASPNTTPADTRHARIALEAIQDSRLGYETTVSGDTERRRTATLAAEATPSNLAPSPPIPTIPAIEEN